MGFHCHAIENKDQYLGQFMIELNSHRISLGQQYGRYMYDLNETRNILFSQIDKQQVTC